jgi:hypothetical protein
LIFQFRTHVCKPFMLKRNYELAECVTFSGRINKSEMITQSNDITVNFKRERKKLLTKKIAFEKW